MQYGKIISDDDFAAYLEELATTLLQQGAQTTAGFAKLGAQTSNA